LKESITHAKNADTFRIHKQRKQHAKEKRDETWTWETQAGPRKKNEDGFPRSSKEGSRQKRNTFPPGEIVSSGREIKTGRRKKKKGEPASRYTRNEKNQRKGPCSKKKKKKNVEKKTSIGTLDK